MAEEKIPKQILDELHNNINKAVGYNVMVRPDEMILQKLKSGILSLDIATEGGFPRGRAINLAGEKSTFKSTLMYILAGKSQRVCGNCMTGRIKEYNHKKTIVTFDKTNSNVVYMKAQDEWYSKIYMANNNGNLFCPGEKIPNSIVDKNKITVFKYDLECSECNNPTYSIVALIDSEHNYLKSWASRFGIINFYVSIAKPDNSQQAGDILRTILEMGKVSFIGVDSLDALGPIEESENSIKDQQMGLQARVWNKIVRAIHSFLNKPFNYNYTNKDGKVVNRMFRPEPMIVIISQYREKIGVQYGGKTTGGGRGKDFLFSFSLDLSAGKVEWIEEKLKGNTFYTKVGARGLMFAFFVSKSKIGRPFTRSSFYFDFDEYKINNIPTMIIYGIKFGFIVQRGAWYYYGNIKHLSNDKVSADHKFQGEARFTQELSENKKMYKELYKKVLAQGIKNAST